MKYLKIPMDRIGALIGHKGETKKDLEEAEKEKIPSRSNIIVATGWGQYWDKPEFLTES